jgi:hypothetical protein
MRRVLQSSTDCPLYEAIGQARCLCPRFADVFWPLTWAATHFSSHLKQWAILAPVLATHQSRPAGRYKKAQRFNAGNTGN